jgi:hypothetical protein
MNYKRLRRPAYCAGALAIAAALSVGAALHRTAPARAVAAEQYLPDDHIVLKSARKVDLKAGTVEVPIHRGVANGKTVWYAITDASDYGIAHDLNVLYAPKLANMAIGCPECVQTVTLGKPTGKFNNDAIIHFNGAPDFSPTRIYQPSAGGFPPIKAAPGAIGDAHYSPFVRIAGSNVVYNMPILATGEGPFDVVHHTNTHDRVLAIDTKLDDDGPEVTMLLARGFDSGQAIVYLSTEASDPGAAAVERATYVPLLGHAPFANGDDNLGSSRERIFVFVNGPTAPDDGQGLMYLGLHGNLAADASAANAATLGSPQNVQGDFPSLDDPRHANAYSPLWDVQLGVWTKSAAAAGKNTRQTDENQILNLVGEGYLSGPGGAPYGSAFDVNCPPIAYVDQRPDKDLASNVFNR